jgi:hypothetical protein
LPPRQQNFFSIPQNKNEAPIFAEPRPYHVTEVHDTTSAGPKEDGTVQPALAAPERASNKKLAAGKMYKRKIPARFEKSNVVNPHNPTLDIVGQENEIIAIKQISWLVSFTRRIESRQPVGFFPECHYKGMIAGIDGKWRCANILSTPRQCNQVKT